LNDVAFVEAAQKLGALIARQSGDDDAKIRFMFRRVLTRPPGPSEVARLKTFLNTQRERLKSGELKSAGMNSDSKEDGATAAEQAAWTFVGRALLNLDETITKQ
jgi:hypothetical protein